MLTALRTQLSPSAASYIPRLSFAAAAKVKSITSEAEWDETLKAAADTAGGVVAQFTAAWCPPCRMIAPVVEDLAGKNPYVTFVKLDIDDGALREVVLKHQVSAVPTFVGYKGGERAGVFTGADKAALAAMVQQVGGAA